MTTTRNILLAKKGCKDRKNRMRNSLCSLRSFVAILFLSPSVFAEEKVPMIGTFNEACGVYRSGDFQASEKLFGEVAAQSEDEKLKSRALYNQGTALLAGTASGDITNRLDAVAEAIGLFEQSLELKPDDLDSKQNLERALNIMISGRISQAEKLLSETENLLKQFQARAAKENCEKAKQTLSPVEEDFAPDNKKIQPLLDRADGTLQMLDRAVETTKEELKNAKHAVDLYEYEAAAEVMAADKPERRWAFDLDKELAQEFQQLIQNNQNVINIIHPPQTPQVPQPLQTPQVPQPLQTPQVPQPLQPPQVPQPLQTPLS